MTSCLIPPSAEAFLPQTQIFMLLLRRVTKAVSVFSPDSDAAPLCNSSEGFAGEMPEAKIGAVGLSLNGE